MVYAELTRGMPTMLDELPTELHELYHSLYTEWAAHLASVGINFPNGKGKLMSLLCLYAHIGQPISQVEMIDWIERYGGHYNRQARHLGGADGWCIASGNTRATLLPYNPNLQRDELMLVSVETANPIWLESNEEEFDPVEDVESKINRLRDELELSWKNDLEIHDVNFPTGDGKLLPLLALYESIGLPLTQDEISEWVAAHGGSYNKQARHLAGVDGWYLMSGNKRSTLMEHDSTMTRDQLKLESVSLPNPIWLEQHKLTRIYEMSLGDWEDILDAFADRGCAVCGRHFPHYDKGHLNPELPMTLDNIVPMCVDCNNWAGASNVHYILDKRTLIARPSRNSGV